MRKDWDVFISHATEDKDSVARPLADRLMQGGITVWLDEQQLQIGDSLSAKIDDGLARSRFGIVILSPNFFSKKWPKAELAGLRALQVDAQKVILPVWHGVDKATVAEQSPILADLLAFNTSSGLDAVARAVADAVFAAGSDSPSGQRHPISHQLTVLLDSQPTKDELIGFLRLHSTLLDSQLRRRRNPIWNVAIGDDLFDAVNVKLDEEHYLMQMELCYLLFLPVWDSPFEISGHRPVEPDEMRVKSSIQNAIDTAVAITSAPFRKPDVQRELEYLDLYDRRISSLLAIGHVHVHRKIQIYCGRRQFIADNATAIPVWRELQAEAPHWEVRTYDALIDELREAEDRQTRLRGSRT